MTDTGTAVPVTLAPDELPVPFGIDAETAPPSKASRICWPDRALPDRRYSSSRDRTA
jgi:hypothetical protein